MIYALLIDDDTALLESVHRTARLAGLEALTAATCEEGIRLFHLHSPDLVIADSLVDDFDVMASSRCSPTGAWPCSTLRRPASSSPLGVSCG
jgi:DNA-binding response OmpR family regulator